MDGEDDDVVELHVDWPLATAVYPRKGQHHAGRTELATALQPHVTHCEIGLNVTYSLQVSPTKQAASTGKRSLVVMSGRRLGSDLGGSRRSARVTSSYWQTAAKRRVTSKTEKRLAAAVPPIPGTKSSVGHGAALWEFFHHSSFPGQSCGAALPTVAGRSGLSRQQSSESACPLADRSLQAAGRQCFGRCASVLYVQSSPGTTFQSVTVVSERSSIPASGLVLKGALTLQQHALLNERRDEPT